MSGSVRATVSSVSVVSLLWTLSTSASRWHWWRVQFACCLCLAAHFSSGPVWSFCRKTARTRACLLKTSVPEHFASVAAAPPQWPNPTPRRQSQRQRSQSPLSKTTRALFPPCQSLVLACPLGGAQDHAASVLLSAVLTRGCEAAAFFWLGGQWLCSTLLTQDIEEFLSFLIWWKLALFSSTNSSRLEGASH